MTTVRRMITSALRNLAVTSANSVPTAEDVDISMQAFNSLLDGLSNNILNVHTINPYRFPIEANKDTYTLGPEFDVNGNPTNADWIIERPMRINEAVLMVYAPVTDPTPPPPARKYDQWGLVYSRNGFDGDVGIAGYIGSTPPFQVASPSPQDGSTHPYLTNQVNPEDSYVYIGAGKPDGELFEVPPIDVGALASKENATTNFVQSEWFMPMTTEDFIWVTQMNFAGYDLEYNFTLVVGPDENNGDVYFVEGSARSPNQSWQVTRMPNIGSRATPVDPPVEVLQPIIGENQGTIFLALTLLNYAQYASITTRKLTTAWPTAVYDNNGYPTRTLKIWPVPQQTLAIELWLWQPLATYETLDDELNLPPGYERYLTLKLAREIAPEFGAIWTDTLQVKLTEAESAIQTLNQMPTYVQQSALGRKVQHRTPAYVTNDGKYNRVPRTW